LHDLLGGETYLFPQGNIIGHVVESPVDESDVVEVVVGDVRHNFQENLGGQSSKIITGFMFVFRKEHYQRGTHLTTSKKKKKRISSGT
jgi:hypothetical protein